MQKRFKRTQERPYSAHHMLLRIANQELEEASKNGAGWGNKVTISITFSALAIEAFANAVGERIIAEWKNDFEAMSSYAKIRFLSEHLDLNYSSKNHPWKTLKDLSIFRNRIAHAKPQNIILEKILYEKELEEVRFMGPEADLEKQMTIGFARKAVEALEEIKKLMCDKIPSNQSLGLYSDSWSGSISLHEEGK